MRRPYGHRSIHFSPTSPIPFDMVRPFDKLKAPQTQGPQALQSRSGTTLKAPQSHQPGSGSLALHRRGDRSLSGRKGACFLWIPVFTGMTRGPGAFATVPSWFFSSPLLWQERARACGVLSLSKDRNEPQGGYGSPTLPPGLSTGSRTFPASPLGSLSLRS